MEGKAEERGKLAFLLLPKTVTLQFCSCIYLPIQKNEVLKICIVLSLIKLGEVKGY